MLYKFIIFIVSMSIVCPAQTIKTKRTIDKKFIALAGIDAGLRIIDIKTTHDLMTDKNHNFYESDPLSPGSGKYGPVITFQVGMLSVVQLTAYELRKHNHRKIAYIVQLGDISSETWAAQNNIRLENSSAFQRKAVKSVTQKY